MDKDKFPRSLADYQQRFSSEAACANFLFERRWPRGFKCPHCGGMKGWPLKDERRTIECAGCRKQTSLTAGTVMHGSKLPLRLWFLAAYLMATHSNGISALQLYKQLGVGSYKTAWLLCAKLRRAMAGRNQTLQAGLVEVDEHALPQRTKNEPIGGGQGRSPIGKMPVIGAVEVVRTKKGKKAPGRVRLQAIPNYRKETLHNFITKNIESGSRIETDEWSGYQGLPTDTYNHRPYVIGNMAAHIPLPWIHRVFSLFKRFALGVYHGVRRKHLQRYLEEFVFRFNRRSARQRAFDTLIGITTTVGPATYRQIVQQTDQWTLPLVVAGKGSSAA